MIPLAIGRCIVCLFGLSVLWCGIEARSRFKRDFTCTGEGVFADPLNCHNYYLCYRGSMFEYTCPADQGFDVTVGECTRSGCEIKPTTPSNVECTAFGQAHEDIFDCRMHYVCFYGVAYHVSCGNNLAYNRETRRCEFARFAECLSIKAESTVSAQPTEAKLEPTTESNSVTTSDIDLATTIPVAETVPVIPTMDCPSGVLNFTDPLDCTKYVVCVFGFDFHRTCPPGEGFNPISQQCSPDGCSYSRDIQITTPTSHTCNLQYGKEADPASCRSYYLCFFYVPKRLDCEPNTAFNVETTACDRISYDVCMQSSMTTSAQSESLATTQNYTETTVFDGCRLAKGSGFYGYEGDVTRYCQCNEGQCVELSCDTGLEYNLDTQLCVLSS